MYNMGSNNPYPVRLDARGGNSSVYKDLTVQIYLGGKHSGFQSVLCLHEISPGTLASSYRLNSKHVQHVQIMNNENEQKM